jgi:hypothetical protein
MKAWLGLLPSGTQIAVIGLVFALVTGGYFAWQAHERSIGAGKVVAADQKATAKTQKRIDDAEARAPRTPADVSKRMRDGTF